MLCFVMVFAIGNSSTLLFKNVLKKATLELSYIQRKTERKFQPPKHLFWLDETAHRSSLHPTPT